MSFRFSEMPTLITKIALRTVVGMCFAAGFGATAYAQDCGCVVPLAAVPAGQAIGQLTSVSGTVNILGANGWTSASDGARLFAGSRIETGAAANASLSVGGCTLNVGPQSAASLIASNQSLCVSVAQTAPAANVGGAASSLAGASNPVVMGLAGGIGVAAGVIAVATKDNSSPVSQ